MDKNLLKEDNICNNNNEYTQLGNYKYIFGIIENTIKDKNSNVDLLVQSAKEAINDLGKKHNIKSKNN